MVSAKIVLVSAVASGQGKTTITAALARKLLRQGLRVRVFKSGPDFLDPKILELASAAPVYNLDLWMVGLDLCRQQLAEAAAVADVILIEGVMGLYDGTPSAADLANALGISVLAVVDASAMAQTCGALAMGLRDYGPVKLAGVVANRIASTGHASMVASSLRDIPLIATMPRQEKSLPERHLGLVMPDEVAGLDELMNHLADQLTLDASIWNALAPSSIESSVPSPVAPLLAGKQIAIARDAAFAFIYPANLECLRKMGATISFFSPLANEPVPVGADAVYLPGGFPELHAETLSGAEAWRNSIRQCHANGTPIWAECGGMMALADTLIDLAGKAWSMAGVMPGTSTMQTRLAGLGPQGLTRPSGQLRGHTFHYSTLATTLEPDVYTIKHTTGLPGEALYKSGSLNASYFHAYFPSCPAAAASLFTKDF